MSVPFWIAVSARDRSEGRRLEGLRRGLDDGGKGRANVGDLEVRALLTV